MTEFKPKIVSFTRNIMGETNDKVDSLIQNYAYPVSCRSYLIYNSPDGSVYQCNTMVLEDPELFVGLLDIEGVSECKPHQALQELYLASSLVCYKIPKFELTKPNSWDYTAFISMARTNMILETAFEIVLICLAWDKNSIHEAENQTHSSKVHIDSLLKYVEDTLVNVETVVS